MHFVKQPNHLKALILSSKALALTGARLITEPALLAAIREDFHSNEV
jgi:hypothetical protein